MSMPTFIEKELFREGILKPSRFTENYDLHCYEPSAEMGPFVEHYFVSRRRTVFDPEYFGSDILSQPVVTLFLKPDKACFEGPTVGLRHLAAKDSPIYAGAQFKPGGFYPFWHQALTELAERSVPASSLIPAATPKYANSILAYKRNQEIVAELDALLCTIKPVFDENIPLLSKVLAIAELHLGIITVGELARQCHMSERKLQGLFHDYIGVGVKWAIMRIRLLEVIKYARTQSDPNWTTIATQFGYSDQSHFINEFKKLAGCSPAQYMKSVPA